jgi:hypothetical protein
VLSFGGYSTVPQSAGAGVAALATATAAASSRRHAPAPAPSCYRTHRGAVAFSLHEQRKVTPPEGQSSEKKHKGRCPNPPDIVTLIAKSLGAGSSPA